MLHDIWHGLCVVITCIKIIFLDICVMGYRMSWQGYPRVGINHWVFTSHSSNQWWAYDSWPYNQTHLFLPNYIYTYIIYEILYIIYHISNINKYIYIKHAFDKQKWEYDKQQHMKFYRWMLDDIQHSHRRMGPFQLMFPYVQVGFCENLRENHGTPQSL